MVGEPGNIGLQHESAVPAASMEARTVRMNARTVPILAMVLMQGGGAALAEQPFSPKSLRVERIVDRQGKFTINGTSVKDGASAGRNEEVETIRTKAEVFFPTTTQGVMVPGTRLTLDQSCIKVLGGQREVKVGVLLSGAGRGCIEGVNVRFDSTVILQQDEEGKYAVAVLAGQAVVGEKQALVDEAFDIMKRYPTISTNIGVGASAFTNIYPQSGGLVVGNVNAFVPLSQHRAKSILYSYTSMGSNFDGYWGASTELGYRWFTPANKSTTSVYLGYAGYDSPSCFSNLVNIGAGWERARWRFGASAGLQAGGCDAGFSFGAINISAPIARLGKSRSAYVSFTPYMIWGDNIASPFNYEENSSSVSPGGRLSFTVPVTERVSLDAYGSFDSVYGASIGGRVSLRIPTMRSIVSDPNLKEMEITQAEVQSGEQPVTQADEVVIDESYKAVFTADGSLSGEVVKMTPNEMASLIVEYLEGVGPLAESNRISEVASENGALTTRVAGILGIYHLEVASRPISETVRQPFDTTVFPTAPYACEASGEAKDYAERELRADGKIEAANRVASADVVYLGRGDKVSDGWPVTTSRSRAYRIANGSVCRKINSIIRDDDRYDGPRNPLQRVVLD